MGHRCVGNEPLRSSRRRVFGARLTRHEPSGSLRPLHDVKFMSNQPGPVQAKPSAPRIRIPPFAVIATS